MTRINRFRLISDVDSTKNSGRSTGSFTIPGSVGVPGNGRIVRSVDLNVTPGAYCELRINSSREGGSWRLATALINIQRTGVVMGNSTPYTIVLLGWHVNSTTYRVEADVINPYNVTMTGQSGDETFNVVVREYLPPFP